VDGDVYGALRFLAAEIVAQQGGSEDGRRGADTFGAHSKSPCGKFCIEVHRVAPLLGLSGAFRGYANARLLRQSS
jgi:hypothetical protein